MRAGEFDYYQQPPMESGNGILSPELFRQVAASALPEQIRDIDPNKIRGTFNEGTAKIPPYFAVTKNSVLRRLKNLVCPFIVKQWSRSSPDGHPCIPITNPNAPELYTPAVFSFFYFFLCAVVSGIRGDFSINNLCGTMIKFALGISVEVFVAKLLFSNNGINGTYPILTLIADFSCISFYLTITSLCSWSRSLYWISTLYCGFAAMLWTLRTMNSEPCMAGRQQLQTSQIITYILFVTAVVQAVLIFLYTPRTYASTVISAAAAVANETQTVTNE